MARWKAESDGGNKKTIFARRYLLSQPKRSATADTTGNSHAARSPPPPRAPARLLPRPRRGSPPSCHRSSGRTSPRSRRRPSRQTRCRPPACRCSPTGWRRPSSGAARGTSLVRAPSPDFSGRRLRLQYSERPAGKRASARVAARESRQALLADSRPAERRPPALSAEQRPSWYALWEQPGVLHGSRACVTCAARVRCRLALTRFWRQNALSPCALQCAGSPPRQWRHSDTRASQMRQ